MAPVSFRPLAEDQVRLMAEQQLQAATRRTQPGWENAGCSFILGFVLLLIPYIGPILFLGCVGAAIWMAVQSCLPVRINPQELAGRMHRLRQTVQGPCPVCHTEITLTPPPTSPAAEPVVSAQCPVCKAPLSYDRTAQTVTAA